MELDAATARLIKILGQMAQVCQSALSAGINGDEAKTREAVDALRTLQAKLGTIDKNIRNGLDHLPPPYLDTVRQNVRQIQEAKTFIEAWSKRYHGLGQFQELSKTSEGRHAILDYALPLDWHFQADVFILFDKSELAFVYELRERGQKRVLYAGPKSDLNTDNTEYVNTAFAGLEIRQYFMQLGQPSPTRLGFLKPEAKENVIWNDITHAFRLNISNMKTSSILGNSWMTQGLANLKSVALSTNISELKEKFEGDPIIIISPGPSLDKNIHLLKELKGRFILMAAAQCARALDKAGVVPNFIVVVDPGNLAYFLDDIDVSKVEALIIGVSCHPEFYNKGFKKIITFNANGDLDSWVSEIFQDNAKVATSGSVSIECFNIAKYFGCSPIIMIGLDLALSEGKLYSSQSANHQSTAVVNANNNTMTFTNVPMQMERIFLAKGVSSEDTIESVLTLPGYYGGKVQTRHNYHLFHGEFIQLARNEASLEKPARLINCTEGGAHITGFEHIALERAIKELLPKVKKNIDKKIAVAILQTDRKIRIERYTKARNAFLTKLEFTLKLVQQCKDLASYHRLTSKQLASLNKTEKKLINAVREMPFISLPNLERVRDVNEISGETSTIKEANKIAIILYDSIEATGSRAMEILKRLKNDFAT